jgi:hypothetical protein
MKILSPALTAKLRSERRDPTDRVASVSAGKNLSISNTGLTTFTVMMWLPKDMSRDYYDVALQVARSNAGISARIVSIKKGKEQK